MSDHKLAVFVEGQAERIFVTKLVEQIAGAQNVKIIAFKARGGGASGLRRTLVRLTARRDDPETKYYVQIVDSGNDERVASDINESYDGLVRQQFGTIIGIRDVYPKPREDIPKLQKSMSYGQKTKPIMVNNVLAVMEVESWFLGEHNHLTKIGTGISAATVAAHLGFDPSVDNMEDRDHPAADLHAVYVLGGSSYEKRSAQVQATVDALDYEHLYCTLSSRMSSLEQIVKALDKFFA